MKVKEMKYYIHVIVTEKRLMFLGGVDMYIGGDEL